MEKIVEEFIRKYALNQREAEVLKGWMEGKTHEEISKSVYLSQPAVSYHARKLMGKLMIQNRHQLITRIIEWIEASASHSRKKGNHVTND